MKRVFMKLLFVLVIALLVVFLLWWNQYRVELDNEPSGENEILNDELIDDFDDFYNDEFEDNVFSGELNLDNSSGDKSGENIDEFESGEER